MQEKKPIRIAQIIGKWVGGGVEAVVMNYYRHIDRSKVQFDFFCDADSTNIPYDEITSLGGKVIIIPPYQKIFKYQRELKRLLKEGNYKIVHSHINTLSVFPLRAAKKAGIPVRIAHSHSTSNKKEWKKTLLKNILKPFSKVYATNYMCCSEYAGRWLFGNKEYDKGNVYLLNNAIDLDKFKYNEEIRNKKREELGINSDTLVIGHIGRFVEQKNHRFLIDIFNEIHKKNPNSILLLAGQGPLMEEMERKVNFLGLTDSVLFLGQRSDANELYQAMDVFLLPSLYEGLPVVGVEAQANGCLCVFSDDMTKETKVLNSATFMSLNDGADVWANVILDKINSYKKDNTKEEMSSNGFDIEKEASKLLQQYDKIGINNKKKIVHVVNSKVFSGLEKVACNIIKELSNDYEMIYITQDGPVVDILEKNGIKYYIIDKMNINNIKKMINDIKPDIIHAHDYRASCICSLASRKIPVISHLHANPKWIKSFNYLSVFFLLCSIKIKKILIVSKSISNEFIFSKLIKNKFICISNPFSRDEILQKVKNINKEYDICCIGRLEEPKDPFLFCDIVRDLKNIYNNIKCVWIGDGHNKLKAIEYSKSLDLKSNVEFVGFKENPYEILAKSKIFVLPTKWEGFGLSVLEALTLGIPCVVSNVGGLKDIVSDDCGKLCNNKNEFVDEIIELMKNKKFLTTKCSNAIIRSVLFENFDKYSKEILRCYSEVMEDTNEKK